MSESSRASRASRAAKPEETAEPEATAQEDATPTEQEAESASPEVQQEGATEQPEAEQQAQTPEDAAATREVPVGQLIEQASGFLGYPSHTAMGALSGDIGETMTVESAKAKVAEWLQQPVAVDEEG
jgi:hypothetical protein